MRISGRRASGYEAEVGGRWSLVVGRWQDLPGSAQRAKMPSGGARNIDYHLKDAQLRTSRQPNEVVEQALRSLTMTLGVAFANDQ